MTALATTEAAWPKTRDAGAEFSGGLASGREPPESQTASGQRSSLGWNPRPTRPFLPFGERVGEAGGERPAFTFTGLREEDLGGKGGELYSAAYRHLRPGLGRWIRPDPSGMPDGANRFVYVNNRPTVAVDRSGLALWVVGSQEARNHAAGVLERTASLRFTVGTPFEENAFDQVPPGFPSNFGSNMVSRLRPAGPRSSVGGDGEAAAQARAFAEALHESSRNFYIGSASPGSVFEEGGGLFLPNNPRLPLLDGFSTDDAFVRFSSNPGQIYAYQTGCENIDMNNATIVSFIRAGVPVGVFHSEETILAHELFGHGWAFHQGGDRSHSPTMLDRVNVFHRNLGMPEATRLSGHGGGTR